MLIFKSINSILKSKLNPLTLTLTPILYNITTTKMSKYNPPKYKLFDNTTYQWKADIDYLGKGQQGVLTCQPYKSQILPYWKFRTPEIAEESSKQIYKLFEEYLENKQFIGADMARKYLQMGYTRARRYANYKGGLKYSKQTGQQLERGTGQDIKAQSARVFYGKWKEAQENKEYKRMKMQWKTKYG